MILVGRVGQDPDVIEFDNGGKLASFSLATSERAFKTRDGQEIPERTDWHNIRVGGGLVNVVEQYVKKGDHLLIDGKLRHRKYEDKDGNTRFMTEIATENLRMLGSSNRTQQNSPKASYVTPERQPSESNIPQDGQPNDDLPF